MDDFGTDYSCLSYLTQLPLSQLKIDQSFVRNIGMARNLGMDVIAEGVETEQQYDFLKENGCTFFQGYLFGKPMPIGDFENVLKATAHVTKP